MKLLAGPEPNAKINASYHRRRDRQPSLHICKFTMCDTDPKNTLSHSYVKHVLVRHLGAVSQRVTTRGASETGNTSHKLARLESPAQGGKYYCVFPKVKPQRLADFCPLPSSRAVFPNRRAAARYRALASIIPGRER
jgi:hypothetical protein